MFLKLRILFTWLAVACAVVIFPIGTFFGFDAAILCLMAGAIFAGLMYLCKQKQEEEFSTNPDENKEEQTKKP